MTETTSFISSIQALNLKKKHYTLCRNNVSINNNLQIPLEELSPEYEYKENNFRYFALIAAIVFLSFVGMEVYSNPEDPKSLITGAMILVWPLIQYFRNNNAMEFKFYHLNDKKRDLTIATNAKTKSQVESFVKNIANSINNKELSPQLTLDHLYSYHIISQLEYIKLSKKVDEHASLASKIISLDPKKI